MSEIRDTHFQGFAKLLRQEITKVVDFFPTYEDQLHAIQSGVSYDSTEALKRLETLIAQHAYDLAYHIYNIAPVSEYEWRMSDIPDLTSWPAPAPGSTTN